MAILPIKRFGDPVLRQRAREVEEVTDVQRRLIADMIETMREAPGVGLAATQVGILERIFVWEVEDEHGALVNPVFVEVDPEEDSEEEGCLSLPGLLYPVERSTRVLVEALDENGEPVRIDARDFQARVFQHELDHLDGVLFIDRLPEASRRAALTTLREQLLAAPE